MLIELMKCDRCGKIEEKEEKYVGLAAENIEYSFPFDLCPACFEELETFINKDKY